MKSSVNIIDRPQPLNNNRGFTLIELLLALLVGSIVLLGVSGVLEASAKAHNRISSKRLLQQDANFGSTILTQQIGQIGYRGLNRDLVNTRAVPVPDKVAIFPGVAGAWLPRQVVKADGTSFSFRYSGSSTDLGLPDNTILSCTGNSIDKETVVESTIVLQNEELICLSQGQSETIIGGSNGIIVEEMLVELGIDDQENYSIDRTILSTVATDLDYLNTKIIRVKLLVASEDRTLNYHQKYNFNGTEFTATDFRIRKEVVVAMAIRN